MLLAQLFSWRMSSLHPMHRLGVLVAQLLVSEVGCFWDLKGLLLKGFWHGMMCAIVGAIQMGSTLNKPHLSDREVNKSRLTQMTYVLSWW